MNAGTAEYRVASRATFGSIAIAGKRASPSLEIAFPKRALKGIRPLIKSVVTRTCGPHPGINPTKIAIRGKKIVIESKSISKFSGVSAIK